MKNWLKRNKQLLIALAVTAAFLAVNSVMLTKDFYYLFLLPVAALVGMLFVLKMETGLMVMALLTPFAIDFAFVPKMELSMPVEPMMILFAALFVFRVLVGRNYDTRILRHPITIAILAQLAWMLITASTSQLPTVSFKYFAARLWFVLPFYFAAVQIFRNRQRIRQFFWCYAIGLIIVVLIATLKTVGNFSDLQTLHRVMRPFYNDHTAYGCVIALFLPAAFYFIFSRGSKGWARVFFLGLFLLLVTGVMFSYCRAAWLSLLAAIAVYFAIRMGMKIKWMVVIMGICIGAFFTYQSDVLYKLGKNHQDSSYDLAGQVKSISNISTDASNLERLNRWASAIRMWKERPVMGCGPGTYQFLYAGYQRSYQLSTISTNAGNLGNAHSEYIGPLTEQGVPGALLVVVVFMSTFATGVRVYRTAEDKTEANMALAFTLSLLTYYVHGVFNNFLDTDKLSVPFWGFTAVVAALDIYSAKRLPAKNGPKTRRLKAACAEVEKPADVVGPADSMSPANRVSPADSVGLADAANPANPATHARPAKKAAAGVLCLLVLAAAAVPAKAQTEADSSKAERLIAYAYRFLGTPYRSGGKTPKGFDCAGYARYVFMAFDTVLPPSSPAQYQVGVRIKERTALRPGDLVFFGGRRGSHSVGHTGIVCESDTAKGNFRFIHAASDGVRFSYYNEPYYAHRYIGASRILADTDWVAPSRSERVLYENDLSEAERLMKLAQERRRQINEAMRRDSADRALKKRVTEAKKDIEGHRNAHTSDIQAPAANPQQQGVRRRRF